MEKTTTQTDQNQLVNLKTERGFYAGRTKGTYYTNPQWKFTNDQSKARVITQFMATNVLYSMVIDGVYKIGQPHERVLAIREPNANELKRIAKISHPPYYK